MGISSSLNEINEPNNYYSYKLSFDWQQMKKDLMIKNIELTKLKILLLIYYQLINVLVE